MLTHYSVRAAEGKLVLDSAYAAQSGRLRFVGRRMERVEKLSDVPNHPDCIVRERDPIDPGDTFYAECWLPSEEPSTVPATGEFGSYFRTQILDGGLIPADAETAAAVGLPFSAPKMKKGE